MNWVGDLMVQEAVEGVEEPTRANRIMVDGEVAVFEQVRNLPFINRFGEYVVRPRRCYELASRPGSFVPLDANLGIEGYFQHRNDSPHFHRAVSLDHRSGRTPSESNAASFVVRFVSPPHGGRQAPQSAGLLLVRDACRPPNGGATGTILTEVRQVSGGVATPLVHGHGRTCGAGTPPAVSRPRRRAAAGRNHDDAIETAANCACFRQLTRAAAGLLSA